MRLLINYGVGERTERFGELRTETDSPKSSAAAGNYRVFGVVDIMQNGELGIGHKMQN